MKLKKFKEFVNEDMWDQNGYFPMTSKSALALYYFCENCKNPILSINKKLNNCLLCDSNNITEIDEQDFYSILKTKVSPKGWNEILRKKEESEFDMIDLTKLNPSDSPRMNIN